MGACEVSLASCHPEQEEGAAMLRGLSGCLRHIALIRTRQAVSSSSLPEMYREETRARYSRNAIGKHKKGEAPILGNTSRSMPIHLKCIYKITSVCICISLILESELLPGSDCTQVLAVT